MKKYLSDSLRATNVAAVLSDSDVGGLSAAEAAIPLLLALRGTLRGRGLGDRLVGLGKRLVIVVAKDGSQDGPSRSELAPFLVSVVTRVGAIPTGDEVVRDLARSVAARLLALPGGDDFSAVVRSVSSEGRDSHAARKREELAALSNSRDIFASRGMVDRISDVTRLIGRAEAALDAAELARPTRQFPSALTEHAKLGEAEAGLPHGTLSEGEGLLRFALELAFSGRAEGLGLPDLSAALELFLDRCAENPAPVCRAAEAFGLTDALEAFEFSSSHPPSRQGDGSPAVLETDATLRRELLTQLAPVVRRELETSLSRVVTEELRNELRPKVETELREELIPAVKGSLAASERHEVTSELRVMLREDLLRRATDELRSELAPVVAEKLRAELLATELSNVRTEALARIRAEESERVRDELRAEFRAAVLSEVRTEPPAETQRGLGSELPGVVGGGPAAELRVGAGGDLARGPRPIDEGDPRNSLPPDVDSEVPIGPLPGRDVREMPSEIQPGLERHAGEVPSLSPSAYRKSLAGAAGKIPVGNREENREITSPPLSGGAGNRQRSVVGRVAVIAAILGASAGAFVAAVFSRGISAGPAPGATVAAGGGRTDERKAIERQLLEIRSQLEKIGRGVEDSASVRSRVRDVVAGNAARFEALAKLGVEVPEAARAKETPQFGRSDREDAPSAAPSVSASLPPAGNEPLPADMGEGIRLEPADGESTRVGAVREPDQTEDGNSDKDSSVEAVSGAVNKADEHNAGEEWERDVEAEEGIFDKILRLLGFGSGESEKQPPEAAPSAEMPSFEPWIDGVAPVLEPGLGLLEEFPVLHAGASNDSTAPHGGGGAVSETAGAAREVTPRFGSSLDEFSAQLGFLLGVPGLLPVDGQITSGYGRRISPFGGGESMHRGIDIGAPIGTPIRAPADGTVIFAGVLPGYGKSVLLEHSGAITTAFGHASKLLVSSGQRVQMGQEIARVGSTGRSTGPHVHFEVKVRGRYINPMHLLNIVDNSKIAKGGPGRK